MKLDLADNNNQSRFKTSLISAAVRNSIFVLGLAHASAHAADITVTSASDNGIGCTLREAINSANTSLDQSNGCATGSDSGIDRIVFDNTEFANANNITLASGQLDLQNKNLEIDAQALVNGVTVSATGTSRVMQVSGGNVTVNNLTITGGGSVDDGGGLLINGGASVTLTDSQISNNTASRNGGGIHLDGNSTLNLQNSKVSDNRAERISIVRGGGIYAGDGNTIELQSSEISNNTVRSTGGSGSFAAGISANQNNTVIINNSSVSYNNGTGIDISSGSSLDLIDSSVENNVLGGDGGRDGAGGLDLTGAGTVNIIRSRIFGNKALSNTGGLAVSGKTTMIVDSVISNNSSTGRSFGGGFHFSYGSFTVSNTTISNNEISNNSSSVYGGGGVVFINANTTFNQVTMFDNALDSNVFNNGSALAVVASTFTLQNSIIADSTAADELSCLVFDTPLTQFNIDSASIIQDGSCGALRNGDPGLLSLANNGGPTETNALSQDSIAINSGDTSTCLSTDQRGGERDVLCDVGAFEFGAELLGGVPDDPANDSQIFLIPLPNGKTVIFEL